MEESNRTGEITRLLKLHVSGTPEAFEKLLALVYQQLQRLARQQLRRAKPSATLDTVALINEAYMRLADESGVDWQNRSHFYAVTARAMRFIIVDNARRQGAEKRGSGARNLTLEAELVAAPQQPEMVLSVNDAIEQLEIFNERLAYIVECRFFSGMTEDEIAESLGVSTRTIQRDWRRARAWLQRILSPEPLPT